MDSPSESSAEPIIQIKTLDVIYFMGKSNEVHALKNINLEIYPGEFIIFFGPSGCGKSTLLYSIAGLELNTHGQIMVAGKDISQMKHWELEEYHRRQIGMIFQAYYLIHSLSIVKNVMLPQIFIEGNREKRKAKAMELLERFGVKAQAHKLPSELSGGQQQRVAICRSLMNDPALILADEPVGNLDSKSSDEVMALLSDLNERFKKTVILVTHNPEHLRFAHRIFYMKDGAVIQTKVNKIVDRSIKKLVEAEEAEKPQMSKELELLLRVYSGLSSAQAGNLLIPFKAKQIVFETLTGLSTDEVDKMSKAVEGMIMRGTPEENSIFQFLDVDAEKGGMGMDRRTAKTLAGKISGIIAEIKLLEEEERRIADHRAVDASQEVADIRQYVLDVFDINLTNLDALKNMDQAIRERLDNAIDRDGLRKKFDLPVAKGGVGFDIRTARKAVKRVELLILGKYK